MEICKEEKENNLGVTENYRNKDRRRFSTCSFSTFPKISYCEADSETESVNTNSKSRKNSFFFLSSYEELNACRKFTPQIIVSSNGFQSLKENNRPSYNLSKEKTQNFSSERMPFVTKSFEARKRYGSNATANNSSCFNKRKLSKFFETTSASTATLSRQNLINGNSVKNELENKAKKFVCFKNENNNASKSSSFYNGRSYSFNVYQDNNYSTSASASNAKLNDSVEKLSKISSKPTNSIVIDNENISCDDVSDCLSNSNNNNDYNDSRVSVKKATTNRADCIRKRIKTHFNQYMLRKINTEIRKYFPSLCLNKLSQRFIADVKIESNKNHIELPVRTVFTYDFKGSKNHLSNKTVVDKIIKSDHEDLKSVIEKSYSDYFAEYLDSDNYINDLKKFSIKEGENYTFLYKKFSTELIEYYRNGTPYKRRSSSIVETY